MQDQTVTWRSPDRPPTEDGPVIVSYVTHFVRRSNNIIRRETQHTEYRTATLSYSTERQRFGQYGDRGGWGGFDYEILAWMPMPVPFVPPVDVRLQRDVNAQQDYAIDVENALLNQRAVVASSPV